MVVNMELSALLQDGQSVQLDIFDPLICEVPVNQYLCRIMQIDRMFGQWVQGG